MIIQSVSIKQNVNARSTHHPDLISVDNIILKVFVDIFSGAWSNFYENVLHER